MREVIKPANLDNVSQLFADRRRHPPATPEELEEYREKWPQVLQMLKEWEAVKGSGGCPVASQIIKR